MEMGTAILEEPEVRARPRLAIRKVMVGAYGGAKAKTAASTICSCGTEAGDCNPTGTVYTVSCSDCGTGGTGCLD